MNTHARSEFKITSWNQSPYDEQEKGPKLLRADVKKSFHGDVEAESTAVLLMCQSDDGSAGYVATERVTGRVGDRTGSFVIQHGGAITDGQPHDTFGYVVPGSGTDALQGLRGKCLWQHHEHEATFTLEYDIM